MKNKWVNALKNIKGKQDINHQTGSPPIIENCHVFLENTYKKITPCDICSQVLRGKMTNKIYVCGNVHVQGTPDRDSSAIYAGSMFI